MGSYEGDRGSSYADLQTLDSAEIFSSGRIALYSPVPRQSRDRLSNAQMAELTRSLNSADQIKSRFVDIQPLLRKVLPEVGFRRRKTSIYPILQQVDHGLLLSKMPQLVLVPNNIVYRVLSPYRMHRLLEMGNG